MTEAVSHPPSDPTLASAAPSGAVGLAEAAGLIDQAVIGFALRRDLLIVSGADAASYLQGQVSQDVEGLAVGATARTLLLQPQGKVDAWLRVFRPDEQRFWLDTDEGHGQAAQARLERFKLRVDVQIEAQTVTALALRGSSIPAVGDRFVTLDATWGGIAGVDLFAPAGTDLEVEAATEELGVALGSPELGDAVRVRQGLPAMGRELDESTIPAAAGIVDRSVDFTKGCYVGQELVARIDSRGNNTPTRLYAFRFSSGPLPAPGTELLLDGAAVGRLTSTAVWSESTMLGLGYLKRSVEPPVDLEVEGVSGVVAAASPLPT